MALDIFCWLLTNAADKIQTLYHGLKKPSIRGSQRVVPDPQQPCMQIPRPTPDLLYLQVGSPATRVFAGSQGDGDTHWFENSALWDLALLFSDSTPVEGASLEFLDHAKVFSTSGPYTVCFCCLEHISHLSSHPPSQMLPLATLM